jgi:positive regulator of sigma E activity
MLNVYRAWTSDWRVIVTVLGWLFVIAGVIRIVLPRVTATMATTIFSGPTAMAITAVIVLVVGGFLSFEGYRRQAGD